jgi:hypothetical protein
MPTPNDTDPEALIARLAGPLAPADREAFRRAALDALARVPCMGEGVAYRALATLQRQYFHPPDDRRAASDISSDRDNKLSTQPPIERGRDRRFTRRFQLVG